jgi:hypothetical protein
MCSGLAVFECQPRCPSEIRRHRGHRNSTRFPFKSRTRGVHPIQSRSDVLILHDTPTRVRRISPSPQPPRQVKCTYSIAVSRVGYEGALAATTVQPAGTSSALWRFPNRAIARPGVCRATRLRGSHAARSGGDSSGASKDRKGDGSGVDTTSSYEPANGGGGGGGEKGRRATGGACQRGIVSVDVVSTMTRAGFSATSGWTSDDNPIRRSSMSVMVNRQDSTDGGGAARQLAWRVMMNVATMPFAFRPVGSMKA